MRTYGAPLCSYRIWQLTRLGTKMGSDILKFETIFGYLRESGSQIAAGDTMQIDHEDLSTLSRARSRRRLPYGCRGLACRRHTACQ